MELIIEKSLEARSKIIGSHKIFLKGEFNNTFECRLLVEYLEKQTNLQRDDILEKINTFLFNPQNQPKLIYLLDPKKSLFRNDASLARFVQDQFIEYSVDSQILNINQQSFTEAQYYFDNDYEDDNHMQNPIILIRDIRIILQELTALTLSHDGQFVDYEKMAEQELFKIRFLTLIQKLPFINVALLKDNEDQKISFFLNCYNILNIHSIIEWKKSKGTFIMSSSERAHFYNKFKYNIAGSNYSLNDIEHGILRGNDNFGNSKYKTICLLLQGKTLSDTSQVRFQRHDPRFQMCVNKSKDYRIHFCLNCGAKSCPPIRVYIPEQLDKQMNLSAESFISQSTQIIENNNKHIIKVSMLFKWYRGDFAKNDNQLLHLLWSYSSDELKLKLKHILDNKIKFQLQYTPYDWTVNNHINK